MNNKLLELRFQIACYAIERVMDCGGVDSESLALTRDEMGECEEPNAFCEALIEKLRDNFESWYGVKNFTFSFYENISGLFVYTEWEREDEEE